jgi:hypothetical protein
MSNDSLTALEKRASGASFANIAHDLGVTEEEAVDACRAELDALPAWDKDEARRLEALRIESVWRKAQEISANPPAAYSRLSGKTVTDAKGNQVDDTDLVLRAQQVALRASTEYRKLTGLDVPDDPDPAIEQQMAAHLAWVRELQAENLRLQAMLPLAALE